MVEVKIIESKKSIEFHSCGHLDIKDLCGTLTIAIKGCYVAYEQN